MACKENVVKTPTALKASLIAIAVALPLIIPTAAQAAPEAPKPSPAFSAPLFPAFWTPGAIRDIWMAQGGSHGDLGNPTESGKYALKDGGTLQSFEHGTIVWSTGTGAHRLSGTINDAWKNAGAQVGALGYPTSEETKTKGDGVTQNFQGGVVLSSPATGAHILSGAIGKAYSDVNGENGRLGYPTTDEHAVDGGSQQDFQNGRIIWNSGDGSTAVAYNDDPPPAPVLDNSPAAAQGFAQQLLAQQGLGPAEFQCLTTLWTRESDWNFTATNPSSGAYGIAQSLPAEKMDSAGRDWATNAQTQVRWGLSYVTGRYGTPCGAVAFWDNHHWY